MRVKILLTLGGLKGYSEVKWISRKKTPPSYTEPGGPRIVDTHSKRLSPFGLALGTTIKNFTQTHRGTHT